MANSRAMCFRKSVGNATGFVAVFRGIQKDIDGGAATSSATATTAAAAAALDFLPPACMVVVVSS